MQLDSFKAGNYATIVLGDVIQLIVIIGYSGQEKIKYTTDGKSYNATTLEVIKKRIQRNDFKFKCSPFDAKEIEATAIGEILGAVPKERFQRTLSKKVVF